MTSLLINFLASNTSKVLLTKLLLAKPTILILDEPTNFLDEAQINWLKTYLENYENAFILVSHDVPFLNSVINVVYHMEDGTLTRYSGNYDGFMQMYELKKRQQNMAYEKQQKDAIIGVIDILFSLLSLRTKVFISVIVCIIFCILVITIGTYYYSHSNKKEEQKDIIPIQYIQQQRDSIKIKITTIDSLQHEKIIEVQSLNNDSTLKLFYKLIGK